MEMQAKGSYRSLIGTLYYIVINLLITLGSLVLLLVAHWLFKWATVNSIKMS